MNKRKSYKQVVDSLLGGLETSRVGMRIMIEGMKLNPDEEQFMRSHYEYLDHLVVMAGGNSMMHEPPVRNRLLHAFNNQSKDKK